MAKVKIVTSTGDEIVRDVKPGEDKFYDDLPYDSDNVLFTEIRSD
jgi:hypothetical protein